MALNFAGEPIPGSNGDIQPDAPMSVTVRTHYPAVNGETEIRLGKGGRIIRYPVWIFGPQFTTSESLTRYLARLDERVQTHGDLAETGNIKRTFRNVTFEGCVPLTQPIRDDAGTMVAGATTYHCQAVLTFYQLTTKDDR